MVQETTQRVRAGLCELIRLVNDPGTPTVDVRTALEESKALAGQLSVLQADAALVVAARECHGDRGVGVLAQSAGLSKRDAAGQVKTAERLQSMPAVRDALESGSISLANAKTLAGASEKTSAAQVEQDSGLLEKAAELSPERFAREAGHWAAQRDEGGGEDQYRRQRARRRLSIWDGDDGMVHLRGELDPVTGAKVRRRFAQEAERLRRLDLHSPGGDKRSLSQRMADALETLTSHGSIYSKAEGAVPGVDRQRGPSLDTVAGSNGGGASASRSRNGVSDAAGSPSVAEGGVSQAGSGRCGCGARPAADITIVQHLSADGTKVFAEIAGCGVIPQSVLEEHFCNAAIRGVVFSCEGLPLWHSHTKRLATKAQMNALRARYGACGGCGADMWTCQGHHIEPVSQGGRTDIDNMMLLCWGCHQKVHHHDWRVVPSGDLYTIEPPERIRYGPARAPEPSPSHDRRRRVDSDTRRRDRTGPARDTGPRSRRRPQPARGGSSPVPARDGSSPVPTRDGSSPVPTRGGSSPAPPRPAEQLFTLG